MFWSPRPAKHISFFVSIGDLLMCFVSVRSFFLIKAMSGFEIYIHLYTYMQSVIYLNGISYIMHTPRPLVVFCFDRWLLWYVRVSHFSISIFALRSAPVCSPVRSRYSATRGIAAKGSWVRSQIGGRFPVVGWGWTDWICDFRWLRDLRCSMSRFGIFGPL